MMTDSIQSQPESTTGVTDTARPLNVAILCAGRIAQTMAKTLTMMADSPTYSAMVTPYAIASRSQDKADKFAATYHLPHAYGSYEAMLADPAVDLVYIATPHRLHAEQAIACMRAGKPVLVEKAFAANLEQARAVIDESDKTGLYCGEAIWTRYMPSRAVIDRIIDSGRIGAVTGINANLCYPMTHKARLTDPNLAGGALLDVGIYPLTFIDMVMGAQEIDHLATSMQPYPTGVDAQSTTTLYYADTTMATALSSMLCVSDRRGMVYGTEGYLVCHNVNNVSAVDIYNTDHARVDHIDMPEQLTGYEYEVAASVQAIRAGKRDTIEMPHADTLRMMALLDQIRDEWGLVFPFEHQD